MCIGTGNCFEAGCFAAWGPQVRPVGIELSEHGYRMGNALLHNLTMDHRVDTHHGDASRDWDELIPGLLKPKNKAGKICAVYSTAIVNPWFYRRIMRNVRRILRAQGGSLWVCMFRIPMWQHLGIKPASNGTFEADNGLKILARRSVDWCFAGSKGMQQNQLAIQVKLDPAFEEPPEELPAGKGGGGGGKKKRPYRSRTAPLKDTDGFMHERRYIYDEDRDLTQKGGVKLGKRKR